MFSCRGWVNCTSGRGEESKPLIYAARRGRQKYQTAGQGEKINYSHMITAVYSALLFNKKIIESQTF